MSSLAAAGGNAVSGILAAFVAGALADGAMVTHRREDDAKSAATDATAISVYAGVEAD